MSDKPEALLLAGQLESGEPVTGSAAAKLRRLHAVNQELLEALQWYEAKAVQMGRAAIHQDSKLMLELMKELAVEYGAQARAAIAKATGENT